jgi:hypothetical protein
VPAVNTYIKPKEEEKKEEKPNGFWGKNISPKFKMGDDAGIKYLPYLLYLTFLGLIYIANNHNAEKLAGQITELERNVKVQQMEYSTLKFEFMNASNKVRIASRLRGLGLHPNDQPIFKINSK